MNLDRLYPNPPRNTATYLKHATTGLAVGFAMSLVLAFIKRWTGAAYWFDLPFDASTIFLPLVMAAYGLVQATIKPFTCLRYVWLALGVFALGIIALAITGGILFYLYLSAMCPNGHCPC